MEMRVLQNMFNVLVIYELASKERSPERILVFKLFHPSKNLPVQGEELKPRSTFQRNRPLTDEDMHRFEGWLKGYDAGEMLSQVKSIIEAP